MQPSLNNPVSAPHRKIQERLRHDQLHVIRFFLAFGATMLLLGLFHARWPEWVVQGSYALGTVFLALSAYFSGRFQIGQEAVLALGGVLVGAKSDAALVAISDQVQTYASLDDARMLGWTFYEPYGQYGPQTIARWAHDGKTWFEYNGLDARSGDGLTGQERLFGPFAYRQSDSAPSIGDGLALVDEPAATFLA